MGMEPQEGFCEKLCLNERFGQNKGISKIDFQGKFFFNEEICVLVHNLSISGDWLRLEPRGWFYRKLCKYRGFKIIN